MTRVVANAQLESAGQPRMLLISPSTLEPPCCGDGIHVSGLVAEYSRYCDVTVLAPREVTGVRAAPGPLNHLSLRRHGDLSTILRSTFLLKPYDSARFSFSKPPSAVTGGFDVVYVNLGLGWDIWRTLVGKVKCRIVVSDLHNDDPSMWVQRAAHEGRPLVRLGSRIYGERATNRFHQMAVGSDLVFTVSEADRTELIRREGPSIGSKAWVVPNGIDAAIYARPYSSEKLPGRVLFLGSLDTRLNQVAILDFVRSFWPVVKRSLPNADLQIVGRNPPERVLNLQSDSITVVPSPRDIRPFLWSASVLIAPFRVGGGTKIKILEAMASGTVVVTTAAGIQGFNAEAFKHYLPYTDGESLVQSLRAVAEEAPVVERIRREAVEFAGLYDWKRIGEVAYGVIREKLETVTAVHRTNESA